MHQKNANGLSTVAGALKKKFIKKRLELFVWSIIQQK